MNIINYIEVWGPTCLTLLVAFLINASTSKKIYKEIFSEKKDIIKHILITFIVTLVISCLLLKLLLYFCIEERVTYVSILNAGISVTLYSAIEILFTDLRTYKANRWLLRYNTLLLLLFNIIVHLDKELILLLITGCVIYIGYLLFSLVNIYHSILSLALILLVLDVVKRKCKIEAISGFILLPSIFTTCLYYIIVNR